MTRIFQKLALLALLPVASLWGQNWCDCGDWSVGADLLIWTHTDCDFTYAERLENILGSFVFGNTPIVDVPGINPFTYDVTREYVKVGYEPGIRVHGRYGCGCSYVELSYLWLELNDSRRTDSAPVELGLFSQFGPPLGPHVGETQLVSNYPFFDSQGQATSISGRIHSRYQNINLEAGRDFASGCWGATRLFANFRWVDIDHRRTTSAIIPELFVFPPPELPVPLVPTPGGPDFAMSWDTTFWGAGLGAGLSADFELCCGLHAGGKLGVMALIGEQKMVASGEQVAFEPLGGRNPTRLHVPSRTCVIPTVDVGLGIGYRRQCECVSFAIDLAYEQHFYPAALSWRGSLNNPAYSAADTFVAGNIGYGGPSLQFTVGY